MTLTSVLDLAEAVGERDEKHVVCECPLCDWFRRIACPLVNSICDVSVAPYLHGLAPMVMVGVRHCACPHPFHDLRNGPIQPLQQR